MELKELRKLEELFKRKEQLTSLKDKLDEVSTDSLLRERSIFDIVILELVILRKE